MYLNCSNKPLPKVLHLVSHCGHVLRGWPLNFHMNCCIDRTCCELCIRPYSGCFLSCSWIRALGMSLGKDKASVHGSSHWLYLLHKFDKNVLRRDAVFTIFLKAEKGDQPKTCRKWNSFPKCPISSGGRWEQFGINSMLIICAWKGPN